jgi:hypothetical protein
VSAIGVARNSRARLGVAVAVTAGAAFAIANTSAGVAYQGGSNPLTVASTRFLLPTAALLVWLGFDGAPLILPKRQAIVAVLLGVLSALYNWALLGSFNSIPFALAVLIIYFYPLIAAVIVATLGWERFSAWDNADTPRQVMRQGAHVSAMKESYDGLLADHGFTSVWIKQRMGPIHVRCVSCGTMNRDPPGADRMCSCGAMLPPPRPFW